MDTYDPKKVKIIVAGLVIVGFADGTKIVGERNTEKRTQHVGTDGANTFVESADDTGTITITLKHNSPSNLALRELYKSKDTFSAAIVDGNFEGDVGIAGSECVVENMPAFERGKEVSEPEWVLLVADYENMIA